MRACNVNYVQKLLVVMSNFETQNLDVVREEMTLISRFAEIEQIDSDVLVGRSFQCRSLESPFVIQFFI